MYSLLSFLCGCHNLLTQRVSYTLYYDIKNHILLYPLFSFLCGRHNLLTQRVSYTVISKPYLIVSSFLFPIWMSQSVHTDCKLYYDINNHILLYPLFSFICDHNLLTQDVSYTMISKTISYCIFFSLSYVDITIC